MTAVMDYTGYCPICNQEVRFVAEETWYRDHLFCTSCKSIPRNRSFFHILKKLYPNYRKLKIHESSPLDYLAKAMFADCPGYSASQFWPDVPLGGKKWGYECQDLEHLTFRDNSLDLFITMDVMEHILDPAQAFREIARVIMPGGAHIFTVPIYDKPESLIRALRGSSGEIQYLISPEYHGNPIGGGALVTREWGHDMPEFIYNASGTPTEVHCIQDRRMGILGEMTDVLVSRKPIKSQKIMGHFEELACKLRHMLR